MQTPPDLLTAIGRFHPLVLHFPMGLIVGVVGLELWIALRPGTELRPATGILLALASAGAVVTAACGLLLAQSGGYDENLLVRHRLFGLGTAALAVTALLLHRWARRSGGARATALYRVTLATTVIAMIGAGYYGGIITHGSNTPFESLAAALRGVFGYAAPPVAAGVAPASEDDVFQRSIQPILESHCYECHGAEKQKHGLRLDSREAALAGGESGKPAIVPGNAMQSRLVEAITLPAENKRAMPPTGKRRLAPAQVLALIDWIDRGALWPDKNQLRPEGVAPPAAAVLERLRASGFRLSQLAQGHPLVRVDRVPDGARLSALAPIAKQIAWLNLAGFHFEPGELRILADMPYLTRLELQHSNVRDADLADVAKLTHLTILNLYATEIGDPGLDRLRDLGSLERLYLWRTRVTPAGLQRLREALSTAKIDSGDADNGPSGASDAANPAA